METRKAFRNQTYGRHFTTAILGLIQGIKSRFSTKNLKAEKQQQGKSVKLLHLCRSRDAEAVLCISTLLITQSNPCRKSARGLLHIQLVKPSPMLRTSQRQNGTTGSGQPQYVPPAFDPVRERSSLLGKI